MTRTDKERALDVERIETVETYTMSAHRLRAIDAELEKIRWARVMACEHKVLKNNKPLDLVECDDCGRSFT